MVRSVSDNTHALAMQAQSSSIAALNANLLLLSSSNSQALPVVGRNESQSPRCNTILAPNLTLSSGHKLNEDKQSFRHGYQSMDPTEANEQFGANPISLGMDNDYGQ